MDRTRHDIARRQFGIRMDIRHEAFTRRIDDDCAFAAQRFSCERSGIAADVDRGRVELHEFEIGEHGAGAGRKRDAVAIGFNWVRRHGIKMTDASGRQHHGAGSKMRRLCRAAPCAARHHAGDAAIRDRQPLGNEILDHPDRGRLPDLCDQRRDDGLARHIAIHMNDAAFRMRCLAPDRQSALEIAIERDPIAQEILDPLARLADHDPRDGLIDCAGTCDDRVGEMLLRCIAFPTAAAMPPCAQVEDAPSPKGAAVRMVTGRGASRSAAKMPAIPPPMMRICSSAAASANGLAMVRPP